MSNFTWIEWKDLKEFLRSDKIALLGQGDAELVIKTDICQYIFNVNLTDDEEFQMAELDAIGDWLKLEIEKYEKLTMEKV